jgi:hypothetical protein
LYPIPALGGGFESVVRFEPGHRYLSGWTLLNTAVALTLYQGPLMAVVDSPNNLNYAAFTSGWVCKKYQKTESHTIF